MTRGEDQQTAREQDFRTILGIRFFVGEPRAAARIGMRGGLVVVPAAPALVELPRDRAYREALVGSDLAITDSGLMVLLWLCLSGEKIKRTSGLEYLKLILDDPELQVPGAVLWVMPTREAMQQNLAWLVSHDHPTSEQDCYLAPHYKAEVEDWELLRLIEERRPRHVIIGIGGGTQEKLGHFLKKNSSYKPAIHCIGAAIGFLSGEQASIPMWADYLFLGWLLRSLHAPAKFFPRYWRARKLVPLMFKYRDQLPC